VFANALLIKLIHHSSKTIMIHLKKLVISLQRLLGTSREANTHPYGLIGAAIVLTRSVSSYSSIFLFTFSPSLLKNCISRGNDPMTNPFAMANLEGVFLVAIDICIPLLQTEQVAYPLLYLLDQGESNKPGRPSTSYCFVTSDFSFVS
jgi:hypothetical protein